jgi:hypothetical protein
MFKNTIIINKPAGSQWSGAKKWRFIISQLPLIVGYSLAGGEKTPTFAVRFLRKRSLGAIEKPDFSISFKEKFGG